LSAAIESLVALGLNQLEAEVYDHLLGNEPMTAYRIGRAIGKPTANVYKAVEALARQGAVLLEEGGSRLCRAVPADEFLGHRRRALLGDVERAAAALAGSEREDYDQAIYQIRSAPLALERARAMLERCTRIAVVDAFPSVLREISSALRHAADRGVDVYLLTYETVSLPGVHIVRIPPPVGDEVLRFWASQQLNLVTDGQEAMIALFDQKLEQVHQAVWSGSLYLASILHAGMMKEHTLHQIASVQHQDDALEQIRQILARQSYFHNSDVPGQRKLLARFGARVEAPVATR
jgi:sugar-specific transcriptional regulator TrmB